MGIRKLNFGEIAYNKDERLRTDRLTTLAVFYHIKDLFPDSNIIPRSASRICSISERANGRKIYDSSADIPSYDLGYNNTVTIEAGSGKGILFIIDIVITEEKVFVVPTYVPGMLYEYDLLVIGQKITNPEWIDNENILLACEQKYEIDQKIE